MAIRLGCDSQATEGFPQHDFLSVDFRFEVFFLFLSLSLYHNKTTSCVVFVHPPASNEHIDFDVLKLWLIVRLVRSSIRSSFKEKDIATRSSKVSEQFSTRRPLPYLFTS